MKTSGLNTKPSKLAEWVLQKICLHEDHDDIVDNLTEEFEYRVLS